VTLDNCQSIIFDLNPNGKWSWNSGSPSTKHLAHPLPAVLEKACPTLAPYVVLGTTNVCKARAVQDTFMGYRGFENMIFFPVAVDSGIPDQPFGMEQTVQGTFVCMIGCHKCLEGAKNRALMSYAATSAAVYSVGVESGVCELDDRMFDVCVTSIFDGELHHLGSRLNGLIEYVTGMSCAFEIPPKVAGFVRDGMDLSQACNAAGLSSNLQLGSAEGCIGVLSGGRVDRYKYTCEAVATALIACNPEWYECRAKEVHPMP